MYVWVLALERTFNEVCAFVNVFAKRWFTLESVLKKFLNELCLFCFEKHHKGFGFRIFKERLRIFKESCMNIKCYLVTMFVVFLVIWNIQSVILFL